MPLTSIGFRTITDPSNVPIAGVVVIARLRPVKAGIRVDDLSVITGELRAVTDVNGSYSLTLERNGNITPANTYWEIEERIPRTKGGTKTWAVVSGATNFNISTAGTITIPEQLADTGISLEAADLRYVLRTEIDVRTFGLVGDGVTVNTTAHAAMVASAPAGSTIYWPDGTYLTDSTALNRSLHYRLADNAKIKLINASIMDVGGVKAPLVISSRDVSVEGGTVDFNRAGQDKAAFNAAGGANARFWFGIRVQGSLVTPLTNVKIDTKIINSVDMGLSVYYTNECEYSVVVEDSGAGALISDSNNCSFDVDLRSIDNDGWKVFPHACDIIRCTDIYGNRLICKDHFGNGTVAGGSVLSDYVSGLTVVASDGLSYNTIDFESRAGAGMQRGVGSSFLSLNALKVTNFTIIGYTDVLMELGGLTNSTITNFILDGRYQESVTDGLGRGIAAYNNGFYPDFGSRSSHVTENVEFVNGIVRRCMGHGVDLWLAKNTSWTNVKCLGNMIGMETQWVATVITDTVPQAASADNDIQGHKFVNCEWSYNEQQGFQGYDLKSSAFIACKANNNGQAITSGDARSPFYGVAGDASGIKLRTSLIGAPLTKTGLVLVVPELKDTQTWTDFGSINPATPTIMSVADPSKYNAGQTVQLIGAGVAAANLVARINDVSYDEVTLDRAASTFPTVAGTGTLSSAGLILTGVGTAFNTELIARYWIVAAGQTRQVTRVASNTVATTTVAFSPALPPGTAFTIYRTVTNALPSQQYGLQVSADTISPRVLGGEINGNVLGNVADNTITATRLVMLGVAGQTNRLEGALDTTGTIVTSSSITSLSTVASFNKLWLPVGNLFAVTGTPALGIVGGGRRLAMLFDGAADELAAGSMIIPPGWLTFSVDVYWCNAGAGAGGVFWVFQGDDYVEGDNLNVADTQSVSASEAAGLQDIVVVTPLSGTVTAAVDRNFQFRIKRSAATEAADTLANDAGLLGLRLTRLT